MAPFENLSVYIGCVLEKVKWNFKTFYEVQFLEIKVVCISCCYSIQFMGLNVPFLVMLNI